jgi:hypothetical protein
LSELDVRELEVSGPDSIGSLVFSSVANTATL